VKRKVTSKCEALQRRGLILLRQRRGRVLKALLKKQVEVGRAVTGVKQQRGSPSSRKIFWKALPDTQACREASFS